MTTLSRRSILRGIGLGGLALGFYPSLGIAAPKKAAEVGRGLAPNVFIHVNNDGSMVFMCHRSEMGQGIRSTLPVIFADELGADMSRVRIQQAEGDAKYGDQNTDGSSSIRGHLDWLRRTAATARTMLITVAAKRWGVKPEDCEAVNHTVINKKSGAKFDFGALADEAGQLKVPDQKSVQLRPNAELKRMGTALPLLDAPSFVDGTAQFGADVILPGMLIAVIARPPVVGGRVVKFDASRALVIPGVQKVVQLKEPGAPYAFQPWGGIAVLADNTWAAMRGRAALDIEWDHGANQLYDSDEYRKELSKSVNEPGASIRNVGDVDKALASAAKVIEAEYHVPHLPHAPMEPPVALAEFDKGKCVVWTSTQNPQAARKTVASTLGISEDNVRINVTFLGGGFGRKSKADFCAEAALLSREAKAPVRVQWTREDDLRHDYFNTVSTQKLSAGLDASGKVIAWRHRTAFPPIASVFVPFLDRPGAGDLQQGVLDLALDIPNVRAEACSAKAHVRIGWLRSVYNIFHGFAGGSFIDELAHAQKKDPKAMWLEVLGPPRHASLKELGVGELKNYGAKIEDHPVDVGRLRNVIERVTKLSKWDERKDRAFGLAAHRSFLSYVAVVVEVENTGDGRIFVKNAWISSDAGQVINLDRVRSQMEGAVVFGISLALFGGVTMKGGVAEQSNFHDMKLARMHEVPREIHVDIVESQEAAGGVGEPGVPPVAPAIANAVFALTGKRIRSLPLKNELSV